MRWSAERLTWQINEVNELNPQPGEWDTLGQQHQRLANAAELPRRSTPCAERAI